jgi:hypothetical protein
MVALDAETGQLAWKRTCGDREALSSPTSMDGRLFAVGKQGMLHLFDPVDGQHSRIEVGRGPVDARDSDDDIARAKALAGSAPLVLPEVGLAGWFPGRGLVALA